MAVTYGFFNSLNGDRKYDATQVASLFDGLISDGIYSGYENKFGYEKSSSSMQFTIKSGRAWLKHTYIYNDSDYTITFDQGSANPRYDSIYIKVDKDSRKNSIEVIKGTATSSPVPPSVTNIDTITYYRLYYIYIPAGATNLSNAIVNDRRGIDIPWVSGIISYVSASNIINQWQAEFNLEMNEWNTDYQVFKTEKESDYQAFKTEKESDYQAFKTEKESDYQAFKSQKESDYSNWKTIKNNDVNQIIEEISQHEEDCEEIATDLDTFRDNSESGFNNWLANLQDQLDDNQAAHLQNEINDLGFSNRNVDLSTTFTKDETGKITRAVTTGENYSENIVFGNNSIQITETKYGKTIYKEIEYDPDTGVMTQTVTSD